MTRRVLVVDDDDDIREVAALSLEAVGAYEVLTAVDGVQGLELARSERPDLILLDVMMPQMDGPTTFRALQADERTREIPVIVLTAKVQAVDRHALEQLGAAAILAKPFDPMRLPAEVARAAGWS